MKSKAFLTLAALALLPAIAHAQMPGSAEQAQSADMFVDSIGVCTHWTYPDTPYGFAYDGVRKALVASGIRHVRDGFSNRVVELGELGIHTCVATGPENGTVAEIRDKIKAINNQSPGAIDAVEGPNEPDLFWKGNKRSYAGSGYEQGVEGIAKGTLAFQKDLYTTLKADPATKNLTVIGPALGGTYDPGGGHPNPYPVGGFTRYVDWGNFHPYPGGNPFSLPFRYDTIEKYIWHGTMPSGNMDEYPYALSTYAPPFAPKPMAATETGYSTNQPGGTSELAHGKYMPRLFCEYFRVGIRRTYSYEFVDEFTNPADREARFGLLRRDLTPKPAYTALKNLIAVLGDKAQLTVSAKALAGKQFVPGKLGYTLTVSPVGEYTRLQYVHHLLLQKRNGDFYLVVWHEIGNEDGSVSPRRQITVPPLPTVLTVQTPVQAQATVYEWDDAGNMTKRAATLAGKSLNLEVRDRVMVVRLSPRR